MKQKLTFHDIVFFNFCLNLGENPITTISSNLFTNLPVLRTFHTGTTACTEQYIDNNRPSILALPGTGTCTWN